MSHDDTLEKTEASTAIAGNKRLDFFRGFLKDPRQVGSVIPSSRFMERKIIEYARLPETRVVVELGPGTGGTTRALLDAMPDTARLLAIDLNPAFTEAVASLDDERLVAHTGSAVDLGAILKQHGLGAADVVISGIPFSTMPVQLGSSIIEAIASHLAPGGAFIAYQFRTEVARLAWPIFGDPRRTEMVTLNIPPMRIWRWERG